MVNEKRLIDANALKQEFRAYMVERYDREKCFSEENCKTCDMPCLWWRKVNEAPTVDAEPVVHAYWIKEQDEHGIDRGWKCSNCRGSVYKMTYEPYKGCPHCRAKMDGGNEDGNL